MRKKPHESQMLDEPQLALRVYLDALLTEATFAAAEEDVAVEVLVEEKERDQAVIVDASPAVESLPETPQQAAVPDASRPDVSRIAQPDWAQNTFQCLSFQVAGVTLAAPLEKLNGIVELAEEITELPGYAPWVVGLLPNRGQNVQVVDIAQIIMPDEGRATSVPISERMKFIILLEDGKFGMAVDSISQVLNLEPDEVRWRSEQSKRPWLAGTVIEKMCALLEIDLLCQQLEAGMKGV